LLIYQVDKKSAIFEVDFSSERSRLQAHLEVAVEAAIIHSFDVWPSVILSPSGDLEILVQVLNLLLN
jgi:hypothetical protein